MNKIARASQNTEAKTLPADVCVFARFGWLLPTAVHSADCRFDSVVKWWIHVSSIVTYLRKISFLLRWKQLQTTLWIVDTLLFLVYCKPTLALAMNTAFSLTNVHAKLFNYFTQLYDWPKFMWQEKNIQIYKFHIGFSTFVFLNIHSRFNITYFIPHSSDDGLLEPKRYSVNFFFSINLSYLVINFSLYILIYIYIYIYCTLINSGFTFHSTNVFSFYAGVMA